MRLLEVVTLELKEFSDDAIPEYAILSHTWNAKEEELSFADIASWKAGGQWPEGVTAKKGFPKMRRAAEVAMKRGYNYIWIDTCCINKDSSQELQTAINAMYKWYKESAVCYIYLEDFEWVAEEDDFEYVESLENKGLPWEERFKKSRWFTRGWTLQELIAPKQRVFFDKYWTDIGPFVRNGRLEEVIEDRTGVPRRVLANQKTLASINIATKMRWAADRQTSRGEDIAYSLLGIFDVNMPLMYGQGGKTAFLRLQEEIIKRSEDETIFAWNGPKKGRYGLLAESPSWFVDCEGMKNFGTQRAPWTQSNKGLHVSLHTMRSQNSMEGHYRVFLNRLDPVSSKCPSFKLVQLGDDKYARLGSLAMLPFPTGTPRMPAYFPQEQPERAAPPPVRFRIKSELGKLAGYFPKDEWESSHDSIKCSRPTHVSSHDSYVAATVLSSHYLSSKRDDTDATIVLLIQWFETVGRWAFMCNVIPGKVLAIPAWSYEAKEEAQSTHSKGIEFCERLHHDGYNVVACGKRWVTWFYEGTMDVEINIEEAYMPVENAPELHSIAPTTPALTNWNPTPTQIPRSIHNPRSDVSSRSSATSSRCRGKRSGKAMPKHRGGRPQGAGTQSRQKSETSEGRRPGVEELSDEQAQQSTDWVRSEEYEGWYRYLPNGDHEWYFDEQRPEDNAQTTHGGQPTHNRPAMNQRQTRHDERRGSEENHKTREKKPADQDAPGPAEWVRSEEYEGWHFDEQRPEDDAQTTRGRHSTHKNQASRQKQATHRKRKPREEKLADQDAPGPLEWVRSEEYKGWYRYSPNGDPEWHFDEQRPEDDAQTMRERHSTHKNQASRQKQATQRKRKPREEKPADGEVPGATEWARSEEYKGWFRYVPNGECEWYFDEDLPADEVHSTVKELCRSGYAVDEAQLP
ncbi:Fc.00g012790.m01.CDS01 [Cosmosporella sp. VM-42]